ncbi:hypothetical protein [Actinoplanes sp. NPDC051411]|uniref:hypothetical protein n=1 Tax=Actinoplanes sp. NPDC051411 TaxID=3155522 RepID=UPI003429F76B
MTSQERGGRRDSGRGAEILGAVGTTAGEVHTVREVITAGQLVHLRYSFGVVFLRAAAAQASEPETRTGHSDA